MKKIVLILFLVFVFIQFFQIDKTNPIVNHGMDFIEIKNTPEPIANTIRNSCYDCHSNETNYPWYSYIQPVSLLLDNHIQEARSELNFSNFATYDIKTQIHKMDKAAEYVEQKKMPLESYTFGHPDAKLSQEQRRQLVNYFRKIGLDIKNSNRL